jgi:hypothetical protein
MATGTGTTTTNIIGNLNTSQSYTYDTATGFGSNYSPVSVNLGSFELFKYSISEKLPPNSPFAVNLNKPGVQTTPPLARGFLPGSAIELLNNNLDHVCDFKFIIDLKIDLGFGGLDPLTPIKRAIRNAKLQATNKIRGLIAEAVQAARELIDAILQSLNFDPSGQISLYWSIGKDIISEVQYWIELAAEAAEKVLYYVFLAKQIKELIDWIKSLPAYLQKILNDCIANFNKSLQNVATQLKSIPDQIANLTTAQITNLQNEFTAAGNEIINSVKSQSSSIPDSVASALSLDNNDPNHLAQLQSAISAIPSADSLNSQTTYYQFSTMRSA